MHKNRLSSTLGIGLLSAASAALVAAFVLAPAALLGRRADLPGAVRRALVEFRLSGGPRLPAQLESLVDYWFQWHAIKVAITVCMLTTFALLTAALWRGYRRGAAGYAVAAVAASVFTGLASGLLILNIQATVVPLVALLPLVSGGGSELLGPAGSPEVTVLVGEVERYYWVLVAAAGPALVVAVLISALSSRRRVTDDKRAVVARRATGVVAGFTALVLVLVVMFGVYSAIESTDALHGLLGVG